MKHIGLITSALVLAATSASFSNSMLELQMREQNPDPNNPKKFITTNKTAKWEAKKTAIVVCDMWTEHWCAGATQRVGEMATRMNSVIQIARKKGVLIIHCPSSGMEFYADTPMRKLAQNAPKTPTAVPLQDWCSLDPKYEAELPIDDSDGGCDCLPQCDQKNPMDLRQIDTIAIKEVDAITDNDEAYYLMKQRQIENVIIMGVHTNMCVLGRPFSIRQLVYQGQNVLLMRDLTDTMYNSRQHPFVSHFRGTDLVVAHIERYWCPTITSADFTKDQPFRFKNDTQ